MSGGHSFHHNDWMKLLGGVALAGTGLGAAGIGPLAGLFAGGGATGLLGGAEGAAAALAPGAASAIGAEIPAAELAGGLGGGAADEAVGSLAGGAAGSPASVALGNDVTASGLLNGNMGKSLKAGLQAYQAFQPPQQQAAQRPVSGPSIGFGQAGAPVSLYTPPTVTQTPGFGGDQTSLSDTPPPGISAEQWLQLKRQLQGVTNG